MIKSAYTVIKPFSINVADKTKAFEEGEVLDLLPTKATRLVEDGFLSLQVDETISSNASASATITQGGEGSAVGDILQRHEKRSLAIVQRTGMAPQTASAWAAESAISSLRRIQSLSTPATPPKSSVDAPRPNKNSFNKEATAKGVGEWAQYSYNIAKGCRNGCVYCYAKASAVHYGRVESNFDWSISTVQTEKISIHQKVDGTVMFPSTHDITTDNLEACIETLGNILQAGNRVLVVSKPSLACIRTICQRIAPYRDHVTFRFTIGSMDDSVMRLLEPNAPLSQERIASLKHAYELGFSTSVSSEPLLGGIETALAIYTAVEPYVTDSIWIGKINRAPAQGYPQEVLDTLSWVRQEQTDSKIRIMHEMMKGFDKVQWKDSVDAVISKKKAP